MNPTGVTVDHKADSAYSLLLSVKVLYTGQQLMNKYRIFVQVAM